MPIGILVNVASVFLGGILGAVMGKYIPDRINKALTSIFGLSAMLIGISMIGQMNSLSAVILSLILGGLIGEVVKAMIFCQPAVSPFWLAIFPAAACQASSGIISSV